MMVHAGQLCVVMALAVFASVFVLVGAGCASASRGDAFRPVFARDDQCVIYVYRRAGSLGRGGAIRVFIDQREVGKLAGGQYVAWITDPGEHFVRVEGVSSMVLQVELSKGGSRYLEIVTGSWDSRPVLERPDPAIARERIGRTVEVGGEF